MLRFGVVHRTGLQATPDGEASAPALWNPNAAANWSLILSPAFGAFLHMKNWHALGEPEKAGTARSWFISVLVILGAVTVFGAFLPEGASRATGLGLLLGWYFASARAQSAYVKDRFGTAYPRKSWGGALTWGVLAFAGFVGAVLIVFLIFQAVAKHYS